MAYVDVATLGSDLSGVFWVDALLKIFGPNGRVESPDNRVNITLRQQGRQYIGRLPQRRLEEPRGGILQIVWMIRYDFGSIFTDYRGNGYGNILQSWRIQPPSPVSFQRFSFAPSQAIRSGDSFRVGPVDVPIIPAAERPMLTYEARPLQGLPAHKHENLKIAIEYSQQDTRTGGNSGEISSRLSISFEESESETSTVTETSSSQTGTGGFSFSTGRGSNTSTQTVSSQGGSFACSVFVPYCG